MARRGFFAELQYQSQLAARERERKERDAYRAHAAALRASEQAAKAADRAAVQAGKAADAEQKRLEKEAREAHIASREADVLEKNQKLAQIYDEIDSILVATLHVDDYVDLRSLRVVVNHPPFDRSDLEVPLPAPEPIPDPEGPVLKLPAEPSGLGSLFGKKKHVEQVELAKRAHEDALAIWRTACGAAAARRKAAQEEHARNEARRLELLKAERDRYASECTAREAVRCPRKSVAPRYRVRST